MKKIIIVGGVAGGMSAATRLRRLMEDAEIIVMEKGPYVSFANCGLPYHISGEIEDRSDLIVQTPEALKARFELDIRTESEVLKINPEAKTVEVNHLGDIYLESYDELILSPGAKPFIPDIKGLDQADNVFGLRNVPDLDRIMSQVNQADVKEAVVVGAGFIGLEVAENLAKRGLNITLVEMAPHVLPPLDEEMAIYVQNELQNNGVTVITGQSANEFKNNGKEVVLTNGDVLPSDLTILSVGVRPENELAASAGIELGMRGGIVVDENYQTSQPNIYAVGDAIIVKQQITGEDTMIALASPANRQGRQVADVIAGLNRKNKGSIGTAIVRVFNLSAASTGLSERTAKLSGLNHVAIHTTGKSHASYFPASTPIVLKLIFDPQDGKILGAQAIGQKGVDKRIDVIATAIKGGLTIFDLPELELTYAPPFGSAKDPVNMIGYAASNIAEGLSDHVAWHELNTELANGKQILDVRSDDELLNGKFANAVQIPVNELRDRIHELDPNQEYIISCASGQRSYIAERILKQKGFKVSNLDGGFSLYQTVRPEEIIYANN
ncbi:FAD-dependent oxidoreductase [Fundicoccus culcitae]|uniref:FAD-dependent oxidoreductase n=1 Tax=Fundicoccus culcitae TaxID=2969821 RepID=A0ABY5P7C8_9LACT|nr:FAD-dependent oxidoreductase [Fundicoccus culcitae]UUX34486.1 FAD-dependent oxidoreductase [Fundicoccus culcitae]